MIGRVRTTSPGTILTQPQSIKTQTFWSLACVGFCSQLNASKKGKQEEEEDGKSENDYI